MRKARVYLLHAGEPCTTGLMTVMRGRAFFFIFTRTSLRTRKPRQPSQPAQLLDILVGISHVERILTHNVRRHGGPRLQASWPPNVLVPGTGCKKKRIRTAMCTYLLDGILTMLAFCGPRTQPGGFGGGCFLSSGGVGFGHGVEGRRLGTRGGYGGEVGSRGGCGDGWEVEGALGLGVFFGG